MCITAIMLGASVIGGLAQASAAGKAANAQERAAEKQAASSERIADKQLAQQRQLYTDQRNLFAPYRESGLTANNALNFELGMGDRPSNYRGFQETPGYQFALDQGIGAIDASAAGRGNLQSGSTLQALQRYGTGMAQQEYGNHLSRLSGQVGIGQASVAGTAAAAQNYGGQSTSTYQNLSNSLNNAYANAGNAQAAGAIGVGNAISGMTNNLSSALMMRQLLQ